MSQCSFDAWSSCRFALLICSSLLLGACYPLPFSTHTYQYEADVELDQATYHFRHTWHCSIQMAYDFEVRGEFVPVVDNRSEDGQSNDALRRRIDDESYLEVQPIFPKGVYECKENGSGNVAFNQIAIVYVNPGRHGDVGAFIFDEKRDRVADHFVKVSKSVVRKLGFFESIFTKKYKDTENISDLVQRRVGNVVRYQLVSAEVWPSSMWHQWTTISSCLSEVRELVLDPFVRAGAEMYYQEKPICPRTGSPSRDDWASLTTNARWASGVQILGLARSQDTWQIVRPYDERLGDELIALYEPFRTDSVSGSTPSKGYECPGVTISYGDFKFLLGGGLMERRMLFDPKYQTLIQFRNSCWFPRGKDVENVALFRPSAG